MRKILAILACAALAATLAACDREATYEPNVEVDNRAVDGPDDSDWGAYGRLMGFDAEHRTMRVSVTQVSIPNGDDRYQEHELELAQEVEFTYPAGQFRCGGWGETAGSGPFLPGLATEGLDVFFFGTGEPLDGPVMIVRSYQLCDEIPTPPAGEDFPTALMFPSAWGL